MNRRYHKRNKQTSKFKNTIINHIETNLKEYIIITIIFVIGIVLGVIFINNSSESQLSEISNYIASSIQVIKDNRNINELSLLGDSIKKNIVLAIFLWFMGSTVIGIFIVYLVIAFRGFCLGYTISSIVVTLGIRKGNSLFMFHNFITKHIIYTLHNCSCC